MEKHLLSKSTFIRGHQCLKSLYLYKKRYFLRDPITDEQRLKFKRGHEVGAIARQLFPGGIDLSPRAPSQYQKAVQNTQKAIEDGARIIYEAGFQSDQVLVFVDVFYKKGGLWNACEVKSSRSISETYLLDAALQYYVIATAGLETERFFIAHIDESYVLEENLDLARLFRLVDVTGQVIPLQAYVKEQIEREKATLRLTSSPKIDVGSHCHDPYPCDFIGHCWKNIEKEVVSIENMGSEIKKLARSVDGNVGFLHISSFRPAIPLYRGTHPYQEIPFQFSLMDKDDNIQSYLLSPGHHPEKLISQLNESLEAADVVVAGTSFQMPGEVIRMQEFFSGYDLNEIAKRVLDDGSLEDLKINKALLAAEAYTKMLENDSAEDYGRMITDFGNTSVQLIKKLYDHLSS